MKVSERLRGLREDLEPKMSQTELGKKLGLSQRIISNIETGRNEPDMNTLRKYCQFFDVAADYILGLTDDPKANK